MPLLLSVILAFSMSALHLASKYSAPESIEAKGVIISAALSASRPPHKNHSSFPRNLNKENNNAR